MNGNKQVTLLIGYQPNDKTLSWSRAEVIAEIETGGTDADGYKNSETIGIARNEFGDISLFRGSALSTVADRYTALHFSDDSRISFSEALIELANKFKEEVKNVNI